MTYSLPSLLVLVLVLVLVACCPSARAQGAAIVVEVNGTPITRADLDEALAMDDEWRDILRKGSGLGEAALRRQIEQRVLDQLVDEILLVEAAKAARIALTPEEERDVQRDFEQRVRHDWGSVEALEQMLKAAGLSIERLRARHRNSLLVRKLVQGELVRALPVRPSDIRSYYERNREAYREPGRVEISQILVRRAGRSEEEARALVEAALQAVERGRPFAEVARGYPDSPNHESGGKYSVASLADLAKEIRTAIEGLEEGKASGIIETPRSFCIVRLDRLTPDRFRSFDDVQNEIFDKLERHAREERLEALRLKLRQSAFIKRSRAVERVSN